MYYTSSGVKKEKLIPHEFVRAEVSAYTSSVDETDDTPWINAAGTRPGPGSIACPARYEFGTKVIIEERTYVCDDRMHKKYASGDYFDVWFLYKRDAFNWGRRNIEIIVLESEE